MQFLILALLYMAGIYYASTIPGHEAARLMPIRVPDYVLHGVAFAGLAVIWYLAFRSWRMSPTKAQWLALGVTALYGLTDEYHQSFVVGRDPSSWDLLADAVGAGVALIFVGWASRRRSLGRN